MADLATYVLDRSFDAPANLVWRSWTEPELLAKWYGPGVETVIHKLDVRPGGLWLNEMRMSKGSGYQKSEYTEVKPDSRLVMLMSNTDENWNIAPNPMMENWPRTLLTTVTFDEDGGKTHMRLTWVPHEATDAEIATFKAAMDGMGRGWGAGMEILEQMLADLQK